MKPAWILYAAFCGAVAMSIPAAAQPASQPAPIPGLGFGDAQNPYDSLGPVYMSQAAGISIRPPAGSKTVTRASGDTVVEFVNEDRKIVLRVTRTVLTKPLKLVGPKPTPDEPDPQRGMLELSRDQLLTKFPNHKKLKEDLFPLAGHEAGLLVLRASVGPNDQLMQEAVIQASELLYYTVFMSSSGQPVNAENPNPQEIEAAALFRTVLDSVTILDQAKLRADQDDRLLRTRSLFLNWNQAKLRSVLIPEQWIRVIKDGKDVGYSYIVEDVEAQGVNPGLKIGIRSRMMLPAAIQLDAETWYHVSFDRRTEGWSSQSFFQEPKGKEIEKYLIVEYGTSSQRRKAIPDKNALGGEGIDPNNPGVRLIDTYTINVHRRARNIDSPPIDRDLPPYYIPQGLGHLLPRLLPLDKPNTYLFASWVTSKGEVMLRYVDVGKPRQVTLAGQKLEVIPVTDRLGLDGAPTTHYMTIAGKYVGSESVSVDAAGARTVLTVLPSDKPTLLGLWSNADLTAPKERIPNPGEKK